MRKRDRQIRILLGILVSVSIVLQLLPVIDVYADVYQVEAPSIEEGVEYKPFYSENWVSRKRDFLYKMNGRLHFVTVRGKTLKDYLYGDDFVPSLWKQITIPAHQVGGVFIIHRKTGISS